MASTQIERAICHQNVFRLRCSRGSHLLSPLPFYPPSICRHSISSPRRFTSSARRHEYQQQYGKASFGSRLRSAWRNTKIEWYPIPVGLGIGFLGFAQLYRVRQREKTRGAEEENERTLSAPGDGGERGKPKKRRKIRPSGPWYATNSDWVLPRIRI